MNALVPIALLGWIAVTLALFTLLIPRRAVLASYLGAWLFLPVAGIALPGFPDYTKITAASVSPSLSSGTPKTAHSLTAG